MIVAAVAAAIDNDNSWRSFGCDSAPMTVAADATASNSLMPLLRSYPPNHYVRMVPPLQLHLFTLVQLLVFILLWFVKANFYVTEMAVPISLFFPFVVFVM